MNARDEQGMTLIEIAVVMTAIMALVGALAPSIATTVRNAEIASANNAMAIIRDQTLAFLTDTGYKSFTIDGTKNGTITRRLVTDGDIPLDRAAAGSTNWQAVVDNATGLTDFLERHLVFNEPRGDVANAYSTTSGSPWLGAYLTAPLDADPWGNRYVINGEFLGNNTNDVVVYSAGPDEQIDSAYQANPLAATDDDIMVLIES
jgi:type II secretory pathway pseudopilin PulG